MIDKRKVMESIPESASLDRTMPAPPKPTHEGKKLGGITQTADSAMRGDGGTAPGSGSGSAGAPKNPGADSKTASPAAKPAQQPISAEDKALAADEAAPDDESALESLGRAIGAPLSGEAAKKEPRR